MILTFNPILFDMIDIIRTRNIKTNMISMIFIFILVLAAFDLICPRTRADDQRIRPNTTPRKQPPALHQYV